MMGGCCFAHLESSCSRAAAAACCSASRREAPSPSVLTAGSASRSVPGRSWRDRRLILTPIRTAAAPSVGPAAIPGAGSWGLSRACRWPAGPPWRGRTRAAPRPGRPRSPHPVDGGHDGLQRIGQDRVPAVATGLHFAGPQGQPVAQLEGAGDYRQRAFAHQLGPGAGERALVGFGPALVQRLGNHHVDDAVAEKFQPLVVRRAGTAMRQGLLKQAGSLKA
jgi:hypothetical protein